VNQLEEVDRDTIMPSSNLQRWPSSTSHTPLLLGVYQGFNHHCQQHLLFNFSLEKDACFYSIQIFQSCFQVLGVWVSSKTFVCRPQFVKL
jgi:hypothetical protein